MKITVVGTGNMGSGFVKQLRAAGHAVRVTGRDQAKAQALAAQHPGTEALPLQAAAHGAEVIVLATPYEQAVPALRSLGAIDGKVVVDVSNPLTADYMGLTVGHTNSAAEQIQQAVPGVRVVKGFNTVFAQVLAGGAKLGGQPVTVFLAADDAQAKQSARAVAESMGFAVMDAGGLRNARYLEPLAGLNIFFGYGAGLGTAIAPTWQRQG